MQRVDDRSGEPVFLIEGGFYSLRDLLQEISDAGLDLATIREALVMYDRPYQSPPPTRD